MDTALCTKGYFRTISAWIHQGSSLLCTCGNIYYITDDNNCWSTTSLKVCSMLLANLRLFRMSLCNEIGGAAYVMW